jgi:hypothetical protein
MSSAKIKRLKFQFLPWESALPKCKFLRLADDMLASPAWHGLSVHAKALYLRFKQKYNGGNCSDISMTYSEISDELNERTFVKARSELIARGFIYIVESNRYTRAPNIYGFTDGWRTWKPVK